MKQNKIYPELIGEMGNYRFKDENGNLSERFYDAWSYIGGFAVIQKGKNGPVQFRDLLGRVTNEKTKSGEDFYSFSIGKIKLEDLNDEYFANDVFYNGVVLVLKKNI